MELRGWEWDLIMRINIRSYDWRINSFPYPTLICLNNFRSSSRPGIFDYSIVKQPSSSAEFPLEHPWLTFSMKIEYLGFQTIPRCSIFLHVLTSWEFIGIFFPSWEKILWIFQWNISVCWWVRSDSRVNSCLISWINPHWELDNAMTKSQQMDPNSSIPFGEEKFFSLELWGM